MNDEKTEPTTQDLVERTAQTRDRVATDVERLAQELTPAHLKHRALDVAEHSVGSLAARILQRLGRSPRRVAGYVAKHPIVGVALFTGAAVVVWRLTMGRQRSH